MLAPLSVDSDRNDPVRDFALPTLLFAALGAMTWAVRGTAGASAMNAHVAPGLAWGAAWWYVARDPAGMQSHRYTSGWIIFALTMGFALAGNRGWVQWANFFEGHLSTNPARGEWAPISRSFGFLWLFVAGAAWAGLPACLLAWCADGRPLRAWEWTLRIGCGLGGAYLAWRLYARFPDVFLPKYRSIETKYHDFESNHGLARLYRDNGAALRHAGYCLGFLSFEMARRDWKNVVLISTVGLVNGLGWALCQNWKWAAQIWPGATFNFWRCWESSAGISIGIAFGVAYFLVNGKQNGDARATGDGRVGIGRSGAWLLAAGLFLLLGWTQFWPAASDLRQDRSAAASGQSHAWGAICIAAGTAFVLAPLAMRLFLANATDKNGRTRQKLASLEHWAGIGLMLLLSWFIHKEIIAGFGDGVRQTSGANWLGPGNIYFCIVLAYCVASLLHRSWRHRAYAASAGSEIDVEKERAFFSLDRLVTYLSLTVIVMAAIGVKMTTWWNAPVCFGLVGAAFGIGYYGLTRRQREGEISYEAQRRDGVRDRNWATGDANLERWGAFVGLLYGLGLTLRKTLKGAAEVYLGHASDWDRLLWNWVALLMLASMLAGLIWLLSTRLPPNFPGDRFPNAAGIMWIVLIAENVVAQVVTGPVVGPRASWNDFTFNLLYLVLFILTAVIVYHYQFANRLKRSDLTSY